MQITAQISVSAETGKEMLEKLISVNESDAGEAINFFVENNDGFEAYLLKWYFNTDFGSNDAKIWSRLKRIFSLAG